MFADLRLLFSLLLSSLPLFLPFPQSTYPLVLQTVQYTKGEPNMTISTSDGVDITVTAMGEAVR